MRHETDKYNIMHRFKELKVWQKAIEITKQAYDLVAILPNEEKYALRQQMCRSAVSIPSNIAEGTASDSNREFGRFLSIANGSLHELETQVLICEMVQLLTAEETEQIHYNITQLQKMLYKFRKTIKEKSETKIQ